MTVNKTVILIHLDQLEFDNTKDAIYLKFPNLKLDQDYLVHINLVVADRCEYHLFFKLDQSKTGTSKRIKNIQKMLIISLNLSTGIFKTIIYVLIISVLLFILLLVTLKRKPKLKAKIKSYLPFRKTSIDPPTGSSDLIIKMR